MSKLLGYNHTFQWRNPHTTPPDGMNRVLFSLTTTDRKCPVYFEELWHVFRNHGYPTYGPTWGTVEEFKRLSPESLAKRRHTRKVNRIRRKYPLLADLFLSEIQEASCAST